MSTTRCLRSLWHQQIDEGREQDDLLNIYNPRHFKNISVVFFIGYNFNDLGGLGNPKAKC